MTDLGLYAKYTTGTDEEKTTKLFYQPKYPELCQILAGNIDLTNMCCDCPLTKECAKERVHVSCFERGSCPCECLPRIEVSKIHLYEGHDLGFRPMEIAGGNVHVV